MKKLLSIAIFVIFLFGCTGDGDRTTSLVNVFLIDAPISLDQVMIEVLGVEIRTTGPRGQDVAESVFFPNLQGDKKVNVLSLIGEAQYLIGRGEVAAGSVTEIVLRLGTDNYVVSNEERTNLIFANEEAQNTTLVVNVPLDPGISHDILIDFDLFKSILIPAPPANTLLLSPSLRVFDSFTTGKVTGRIRPEGEGAILYAIANLDTIASTRSLLDGNFTLRGLRGNYTIAILPYNIESYATDTLRNVSIVARQTTELGNLNLTPRE